MFVYRCKYCSHKLNNREILKSGWLNIHMKFNCEFCGAKYRESGLVKFIMTIYIFLPIFMGRFIKQFFGLYFGIIIGVLWISSCTFLAPYLIIAASKHYENKE